MESGAPHVARSRHSDHRECRRRSRRAHRQALHVPGLSVEMARGRRLRHPAGRHARSVGHVPSGGGAAARSAAAKHRRRQNPARLARRDRLGVLINLSIRLGPRHAAMAVARQSQCPRRGIPCQGRPAGAAVRRHHASRHPHGRADPCGREPADADRLSAVALLRHRRRGVDPERQMGRDHAEGSGEAPSRRSRRTTS